MEDKKILNLRLTFGCDVVNDTKEFTLIVPKDVSKSQIMNALKTEHDHLCLVDETDIYGEEGRTPETLLEHVCKKYNWKWKPFQFDIGMYFD